MFANKEFKKNILTHTNIDCFVDKGVSLILTNIGYVLETRDRKSVV